MDSLVHAYQDLLDKNVTQILMNAKTTSACTIQLVLMEQAHTSVSVSLVSQGSSVKWTLMTALLSLARTKECVWIKLMTLNVFASQDLQERTVQLILMIVQTTPAIIMQHVKTW